ncbi:DUF4386 domain-containing protein [Dyella sp.]|jgi:hypothetical protein|uniref:DUF4386 domain-containing protein n=1 Tax=Dyella sp. TaxID=1869338 RepID=UPI002D76DA38|nr:DUF4386 domain-containing protein [Dyella sp.]HET6432713.1 DUF4386 domain-containing protein [Dyella sp.]
MAHRTADHSPQALARLAGALYLVIIVAGALGELLVRGRLVVPGDALATATRIGASPMLWRLGVAGDLLMHVCDVFVMWALYVLLRPVSRRLALLNLLLNLIQTAALVANKLTLMVPLLLLGDAPYLAAIDLAQRQAWSLAAIELHEYGFGIGLIFFGCVCLLEGYLIRTSGYLPRLLGMMMQLAGACYLVNSFTLLLVPAIEAQLFPAILMPCLVAELSLALWLLLKGVDLPAFTRRALARGG